MSESNLKPQTPLAPNEGTAVPNVDGANLIGLEEFKKVSMIVAQIVDVKPHPNADKLYVLQVAVSDTERRQIVAGIRAHYTPQELLNRRIILVVNLKPAVLRGETSQGMLLAASDQQGSSLLMPDRAVALGSSIR